MRYLRKYLVNVLSLPTELIIDKNKIMVYFIDSDEEYTMMYKQTNKDEEDFYKIIKKVKKYDKENDRTYFDYETENCTEETFESFKNVRQGNIIEKNRVVLKVDEDIIYIEDYINENLSIAKVIFDDEKDFFSFRELDFLGEEISTNEKYKDLDFKLTKDMFEK